MKMNKDELLKFFKDWLSAWTGNNPNALLEYYHENALYIDPANKEGLRGHKEIGKYFEQLLHVYPDWIWKPIEVFPVETGAIVKWQCAIPVGQKIINEIGLDIVEIKDEKITRNEVYFDRTELLAAVEKMRRDR
jgi:hypothetical protein